MPVSRLLIQGAVKCPRWQEFRKSLKGLSTQAKLNNLYDYTRPTDWGQNRELKLYPGTRTAMIVQFKTDCECDATTRRIQAINYLNALARGGQIEPVGERWTYIDQVEEFLRRRKYTILK
jgi:hypothetical protein